jgi:general secretion pathway protein D
MACPHMHLYRRSLSNSLIRCVLSVVAILLTVSELTYAQQPARKPPTPKESANDATSEINVRNADLGAIIKIFSRKTKRNYILDENVKGKITIYLPGKISDAESNRILESILAMKGFTTVPIGANLWKIVPAKDAKKSTIPTLTDEDESSDLPSAAVITRLVRLKYVSAEDMQKLLSQLISPDGLINAYNRTNSLIIIDSEDNVERLVEIVRSVDVPSSSQDMTIIPVKHADAQEVATTLQQILGIGEGGSGSGTSESSENPLDLLRNRFRQNAAGNMPPGSGNPMAALANATAGAQNVTIAASGPQPKVIPDLRTNALIVVADEQDTARIRALIATLDSELDLSGFRYYVYRCQHANAEELAEVLGGLGGDSAGSSSSKSMGGFGSDSQSGLGQSGTSGLGSSRSRSGFGGGSSSQSRLGEQSRTPGRSRSEGAQRNAVSSVTLGENVSITADPATNSLIIAASRTDYEKILELLSQLDIKRRQVLVEAMLLEVSVTKGQAIGTEFLTSGGGKDGGILASANFQNLSTLLSDPTKLSDFSVAAASSGTLTLPGDITIPTQAILISAAQSNSNVNVLSSPTILATDNEQAEIIVGQNVPFVASTSSDSTNLNNTFNQVDRQDVGITLRITPQISSGDSVTLNIFTEVSNVIEETASSALGPTTTLRTSETTVITKDGQMIVTGGLISDDINEANRGVPFLKDIPVLGGLFRFSTESRNKRNLLIFITPRIIKDQYDAHDATIVKRERMEDVLVENDLYPRREDVLRHADIDKVAENNPYKGAKPTTIRARRAPVQESEIQDLDLSSPPLSDLEGDTTEAPLELRAIPKLPGEKSADETSTLEDRSESGNAADPASDKMVEEEVALPGRKSARGVPGVAIVLQPTKKLTVETRELLPFPLSSQNMVAVVIPPGSLPTVQEFFSQSKRLAYHTDAGMVQFDVVGTYESLAAASRVHPEVAESLYTLSPHEIFGLGREPWAKDVG